MPPASPPAAPAAALLPLLVLVLLAHSHAQTVEQVYPPEVILKSPPGSRVKIQRPVGVVKGLGTNIFVATVAGQLYYVDIRTGIGAIINPGGDDQPFAGVCLDSRGPGTLYATGRESGVLFAFNRRGELLQRYQIVNSTKDGGNSFLAGCIQTRYQLIITDAFKPFLYFLSLADEGPLRGHPPPPSPDHRLQGFEVPYGGDWTQIGSSLNAFGVEWTSKFNETAFVLNKATGQLYYCTVKKEQVFGDMRKVLILGHQQLFPGALHTLFDSTNENILYISMPHRNAIAVLEFSPEDPGLAKYIRMIRSPLLDGPAAISEDGDQIYPVNARFSRRSSPTSYSLVRLPGHEQSREPGQNFTTSFDGKTDLPPIVKEPSEIEEVVLATPVPVGTSAPYPITPQTPSASTSTPAPASSGAPTGTATPSPNAGASHPSEGSPQPSGGTAPPSTTTSGATAIGGSVPSPSGGPSSVFQIDDTDEVDEDDSHSCFPGSATVRTDDGRAVRMDSLSIGDRVAVGTDAKGNQIYSAVYLFSHQDRDVIADFVRIFATNDRMLDLSAGHYLHVNGKLMRASAVRVGDELIGQGGSSIRVLRVMRVRQKGLYNPQTMFGNIVVNGVLTSTFTSAVEPAVASALLSPLRAAYRVGSGFSRRIAAMLSEGGCGMENVFPGGRREYMYL